MHDRTRTPLIGEGMIELLGSDDVESVDFDAGETIFTGGVG